MLLKKLNSAVIIFITFYAINKYFQHYCLVKAEPVKVPEGNAKAGPQPPVVDQSSKDSVKTDPEKATPTPAPEDKKNWFKRAMTDHKWLFWSAVVFGALFIISAGVLIYLYVVGNKQSEGAI